MLKVALLSAAATLVSATITVFYLGEGGSYLSDKPTACINCHVMNDAFYEWQSGGHRHVATCNDCHTPNSFVSKYTTKAMQGLRHSFYFTFENYIEPLQIAHGSKAIVEKNCQSCHANTSHFITNVSTEISCVHCHKQAGHR